MDTKLGIAAMPAHEDDDDAWRAWADGYPTVRAINMNCTEVRQGSATFVLCDPPFPPNPNGAVNGGILALAADQIMGVLAARVAPTGSVPATAALSVQYHSPAYPPLAIAATAVPGGRFVQAIEVVVRDGEGRRCATAMGTMAVGPGTRRAAGGS
jgi:uncharacterized protein (TIGR00369 family)